MNALIIVFLGAAGGAMIGLYYYNRQRARLHYFYDLVSLIDRLISDVRFRQDKLTVVMSEYAATCNSSIMTHLSEYTQCAGGQLTLSRGVLTGPEHARIHKFFASLGYTDSGTQLLELDGHRVEFAGYLDAVKNKHNKYGTVYVKLGLALGIGVGILFV
jgi:hypothetical protein